MPLTSIPIPIGFYQSESLPLSAQRCINWIPTVSEGGALNQVALFQPLGLKEFANSLVNKGRGSKVVKGVPYFVQGNSLISVSSSGATTNHGTIPGKGRVSLANSSRFLVIVVPGNSAFVFDNDDNSLSQITDPDFIISDTVVFKDTFFVFTASSGDVFFHSELNDPLDFDALDFGTAEISPDPIVAAHVNHNELFIAGSETIELFQNVGGAGFVFQRIPGANIQKGVHAKFSLIEFDNSFCFVGGGLNERSAIWKVSGSSSAVKISTNAIDNEIQKFTEEEIADSFAMTFADKGQFFAVFTFESTAIPSRTFVYNATASALSGSSVWFELQEGVNTKGNRWQVASIASAYGKLLVSDLTRSTIGELDGNELTYYGEPIFRSAATQPFSQDGIGIFAGTLECTFESGVGLTLGQGDNPQVRMDFSDNGGRTFSSEFSRSIGKIGEYTKRSIWNRQGHFPVSRTIRVTITDPVKANLIKMAASPDVGVQ